MRRENDLDIDAGSARERLGDLGRMTMRQAIEPHRFIRVAEMRLGRRLAASARHAGKRRDGNGALAFEAGFHDGQSRQSGSRGVAARTGDDGRACLELVASDLGQAIDRLRQQIDARVLSVVPRLVYLRIGQTIVRRQI